MEQYIVLLRGINVGGQKKIKMVDLKTVLEDRGFDAVKTYIQSGNLVLSCTETDPNTVKKCIETIIVDNFGFVVPVFILTPRELQLVYNNNPFLERINDGTLEANKMYFTLLAEKPKPQAVNNINSVSNPPEEFVVKDNVVYLYAAQGYGKTKLNNTFFEKKLACEATTRNYNTINKLLKLSGLRK
ncbi:DUF1697 domain-containing protein [Aquimarina brevivitae]|uniref:Uncharacterized protein (DUF1697 family) n=1 Tax=Aquimarina brevivitae TaxID=323412 RepID=A0A4Q7PLB1_9FLAO|nr:DUF1697 domain-containing protein [Aquimarina brevivitae]RZS99752.1 uncharacterized protein (DUF1697 family) [Aquimarina brevivitae]